MSTDPETLYESLIARIRDERNAEFVRAEAAERALTEMRAALEGIAGLVGSPGYGSTVTYQAIIRAIAAALGKEPRWR